MDWNALGIGWVVGFVALLGLLVGSFLNVVVYRLPKMMERDWREQALDILELSPLPPAPRKVYNLVVPGSACTDCQRPIRAWENIPIVSYLVMRGRCICGKNPISIRYPIVEGLTALFSGAVAWRYGATAQMLVAVGFVWALVALTYIDYDTMLLPDEITLPLVWYAILANFLSWGFTDLRSSILGAVFGYLVLWSVYWIFKLLTRKEGMGYGDFKLLAAIGALLGWQALPMVVLLSSLVGAVIGIGGIVFGGASRDKHIPFGPYLAMAGFIGLLTGPSVLQRLVFG